MKTDQNSLRILLVEDNPGDARLVQEHLTGLSAFAPELIWEKNLSGALNTLAHRDVDIILLDLGLPESQGMETLRRIRGQNPLCPVVVLTGLDGWDDALAAVAEGAQDYLNKGEINGPILIRSIRYAVERTNTLKALEESEAHFRAVVESAPDAIITVSASGQVALWNQGAEATFGYKASEITGQSISQLLPHPARKGSGAEGAARKRALGELEHSGRSTVTTNVVGKDGRKFPAEISVSRVSAWGQTTYTAVIRDVSERWRAQEALEGLSREYELLLNSAGEGIVALESDGTIGFCNPAALALLGRTAEEVLGRTAPEVLMGTDPESGSRDPAGDSLLEPLRSGAPYRGQMKFVGEGGHPFPVELTCTPKVDEHGAIEGAVLLFEDITDRLEQSEALEASEARYRSLVENATYGIYRSTPDGRFLSVNGALVEMLGYESRMELLCINLYEDLYENPGIRDDLIRTFDRSDQVMGLEARWLRKDGSPITVLLSGRPVRREDGSLEAFEVMVEDLSERRALEEQLRQAQKMEAVGQLTGGIAHDFNNVLGVILLTTELVMSAVEHGEGVSLSDLKSIQEAARRATSITRKLLGFSRRAELNPKPESLSRIVANMSSMLRTVLPETIELVVEPGEDLPSVKVDTGSIEQILLNLATNSRDAMPTGGTLEVSVEGRVLDEDYCAFHPEAVPGRYVCLEVADTGIGMDDHTLSKIFDPFFTTKEQGLGTGLGMAMVYGLTKQQGGYVYVYSEVGRGTRTHLYFPALEEEEDASPLADLTSAPLSGEGILLLVEDEENLRQATARALERYGYTVREASGGAHALEILQSTGDGADLIITDLVLPDMSGIALLEQIHDRYGRIPCILSSGYSLAEVKAREEVPPELPFLRKPWQLNDLLDLVSRKLRESREKPKAAG